MELEKKLKQRIQAEYDKDNLRGASIMVRKNGKEVLYVQQGYANVGEKKPIERNSIFRMYSQTKIVTSIAAMILMDRGIIDMWEGVQNYIPSFEDTKVYTVQGLMKAKRHVQIADLFSMTAGLCYPDGDVPGSYAKALFDENAQRIKNGNGMSTMEFCSRMGELPLAFQPGEQFRYSTCADVLGAVVEAASGKKFEDFLKEEIFEPLDMKDTAFFVPHEKQSRVVTPYCPTENGMEEYENCLHLCIMDKPEKQPSFSSGGAGLFSTIDDFAAIPDMLLNEGVYNGRRILSRNAALQMRENQLTEKSRPTYWEENSGDGYGYLMTHCENVGQSMLYNRMGRFGWGGWMGTCCYMYPNENISIMIMQNVVNCDGGRTQRKLENIVMAAQSNGEF